MNKIIIGILFVAAIAITWFILNPSDTFDYVVTVDSEISELESELASLDAQVAAGTLSEAQATQAKVQIITRLNTINIASIASEAMRLTPAQRTQLVEGLDRLKTILITYQATLATVDATADNDAVEAIMISKTRTRSVQNSGNRPLNLVVAAVIADVEETVQDSVQDYEPNTELDAEIEVVVDETEADVAAEEAIMDDEDMSEEVTESDDMESDMDDSMDTMDDEVSGDEPMIDVEVSADADLDATTTN